ncbi:hypothetical protein ACRAWG_24715 [Methylobacterium sp. P31]
MAGEDERPRGPTHAALEERIADLSGRLARVLPMVALGIDGSAERAASLQAEIN